MGYSLCRSQKSDRTEHVCMRTSIGPIGIDFFQLLALCNELPKTLKLGITILFCSLIGQAFSWTVRMNFLYSIPSESSARKTKDWWMEIP